MAGFAPPPTALMAQMVVLSTKLEDGYPQLSVVIVAGGTVMPGVHEGAPDTALQLLPMLPPGDAQFAPLQQRLGSGGGCVLHVSPGAQPPVESQRQPWVPMMHVVGAPDPAFPPSPPRKDPSLFPAASPPPLLLPASALDALDAELPHP